MKRPLIFYPAFRLIGPTIFGAMIYLFILLVNNQVYQLQDQFIGQELYLCIALSFLIQESCGLFLYYLPPHIVSLDNRIWGWIYWFLFIAFPLVITIGIVTVSMILYYELVLGFSVTMFELIIFNGVFICFTGVYVALFLIYKILHRMKKEQMKWVLHTNKDIAQRYQQFKQGIHTDLLFESLESLIVIMKNDKSLALSFIGKLSEVYRYILSDRKGELVQYAEELVILKKWVALLNHLPYRNIVIEEGGEMDSWLVPGSLLHIVEGIARSSILSREEVLVISIEQEFDSLLISYKMQEKLMKSFEIKQLEELQRKYALYSERPLTVIQKEGIKIIKLPRLISVSLEV